MVGTNDQPVAGSPPPARRDVPTMSLRLLIVIAILGLTVGLLIGYMRRLFRRSRELEKRIDYSKMREWKDDD
jgi:NhaP-type Na+/H+ or K+/H+ antiporter